MSVSVTIQMSLKCRYQNLEDSDKGRFDDHGKIVRVESAMR